MAKIVGLPKLSPTMEEGVLAKWVKKEGDAVNVDDIIAEVETDKATMEWRALDKGFILKILVKEGDTLLPDTPSFVLGEKGETFELPGSGAATVAPAVPAKATAPATTPSHASAVAAHAEPKATMQPVASGRVAASPYVRKVAREKNISLESVLGSGPHGRIVFRDLSGIVDRKSNTSVTYSRKPATTTPLSQMRKTIAKRLTESKQTVPHFYLNVEADVTALLKAREAINAQLLKQAALPEQAKKVSVNDFIIKAAALALRDVPAANASFTPDGIVVHHVVDISVAVSVPDGLVTPVVRDADQKHVSEISEEVKTLAQKAKTKKLSIEEMTGGTFSISNLGMFGVDSFAAVINPPEGAILAVGRARDEVGWSTTWGAPTLVKKMSMTLSCDHRVVDGALGAQLLAAIKAKLEEPTLIFL